MAQAGTSGGCDMGNKGCGRKANGKPNVLYRLDATLIFIETEMITSGGSEKVNTRCCGS